MHSDHFNYKTILRNSQQLSTIIIIGWSCTMGRIMIISVGSKVVIACTPDLSYCESDSVRNATRLNNPQGFVKGQISKKNWFFTDSGIV